MRNWGHNTTTFVASTVNVKEQLIVLLCWLGKNGLIRLKNVSIQLEVMKSTIYSRRTIHHSNLKRKKREVRLPNSLVCHVTGYQPGLMDAPNPLFKLIVWQHNLTNYLAREHFQFSTENRVNMVLRGTWKKWRK